MDSLEQAFVHDGSLLPRKNLALVADLTDEEPVAEEVGEGASAERNAPAGLTRRTERPRLGTDVFGSEIAHELIDAGYLQIPAKDQPHPFGFFLNHDKLAVLQLIAEGGGSHPESPAFGGGDLVANALGGDLPVCTENPIQVADVMESPKLAE